MDIFHCSSSAIKYFANCLEGHCNLVSYCTSYFSIFVILLWICFELSDER